MNTLLIVHSLTMYHYKFEFPDY